MLLTSGHIPMLISSSVVCIFTCLLFFSGYVLQQRTVASLQYAIKPRIQPPKLEPDPLNELHYIPKSKHGILEFGGNALHSVQTRFSGVQNKVAPWSRLAYVQVVKKHGELCNAVMLFGELQRMRSPARKILLFPREWVNIDDGTEEEGNVAIDTSKRLLRLAARRYGVRLHPIEPLVSSTSPEITTYPDHMASIFSLTDYDRILFLSSPGLLLDAQPFDSLLRYGPDQELVTINTNSSPQKLSTSIMLIKPNAKLYERLIQASMKKHLTGAELLQQSFTYPEYVSPEGAYFPLQAFADTASIVRRKVKGGLKSAITLDEEKFFQAKAYVEFSDPTLPGPEFDVPIKLKNQAMPWSGEARAIWERLYEMYRQKRMEICRLDLESWPETVQEARPKRKLIRQDSSDP